MLFTYPCREIMSIRLVARSKDGVEASNPTQGLDVCVWLLCVCAFLDVGAALRWFGTPLAVSHNRSTLGTNVRNSVALSPQANYTDWATAICRRNLMLTFVDRKVSRGQRGGSPTVVNLSLLDIKFRSSPILFTLMMEAMFSSETSVPARDTPCNISEDVILHSRRRENRKSYVALSGWTL
jgi:hypothetical protein